MKQIPKVWAGATIGCECTAGTEILLNGFIYIKSE